MNRSHRPIVTLVLAWALLLGVTAIFARQPGPAHASPASQAATATPRATASPTPSPPDATLAAAFARQGKVEEAIGAYLAVIEQGTTVERLAARAALARVYLDDDQVAATVRELDAYLLEAPAGTDVRGVQYLLAESLALEGDPAGALVLYDAYIEKGGGASTYARIGRAEALARLDRGAEAAAELQGVLGKALPHSVRRSTMLTTAQLLEESQPEEALAWYERLGEESESPEDTALVMWRSALIEGDLGDAGAPPAAWVTIIQRFPETSTAQAIVDDPPAVKIMMDSFYSGLVYYRGGRDSEAREAFEASLEGNASGAPAARASYYLAVLDERAGDVTDAIEGYGRVVELDPRVELADDALWWQGRLLEEADRTAEAVAIYEQLVSQYGGSSWGAEARFRLALLDYDGGGAGAAEAFADIAESAQGEARQRALLWQGKALADVGEKDRAEAVWRELQQESPTDYYGLRASVLLGDAGDDLEDAGLSAAQEPDWRAIEAWLFEATGDAPSAALEGLLYDKHWGLGQELLALGMRRRAGTEFGVLLDRATGDPGMLYQLARSFHSAAMTDLSSRAAARLLLALPEEDAAAAPLDVWRLAYPAPFAEALREAADGADVPDVLLLALVRQESFFDPLAGSSAGAIGLTQVIPATGAAIAQDLRIADFTIEELFRPSLSLRFGAHYLQEQLDTFDGNVYHALAAYNGGPGSALRWRRAAGDDVDRFVEEIDFSQTEAYVKLVMENLARYRQLYQGLEEPALPKE